MSSTQTIEFKYHPFGMVMPGRSFTAASAGGYRFGFNGEESDSETYGTGNVYDYGFRIYNPRIGKFLSIDPLTNNYPELTPFQFASNQPIWGIDIDGLEIGVVTLTYDKQGKVAKIRIVSFENVAAPHATTASTPIDMQLQVDGTDLTDQNYVVYHVNLDGSKFATTDFTNNPDVLIQKVNTDDYLIQSKINTSEVTFNAREGASGIINPTSRVKVREADINSFTWILHPEASLTEKGKGSNSDQINFSGGILAGEDNAGRVYNSGRKDEVETALVSIGVPKTNFTSLPVDNTPLDSREKVVGVYINRTSKPNQFRPKHDEIIK